MTIDRFTLEDKIMSVWNMADDLNEVFEYIYEMPDDEFTRDNIANILLGMSSLMNIKSKNLFDTYEDLVINGYLK